MAAYGTEVPHQDGAVQAQFADGVASFVDSVANRLPVAGDDPSERRRAIAIVAALVGGLTLARAPELSAEILASVRAQIADLALPEDRAASTG